jgi:hypothetical protein
MKKEDTVRLLTCAETPRQFFTTLSKGDLVGFSQGFTRELVEALAWEHGVKLTKAPKPKKGEPDLREYLFKVSSVSAPPSKNIRIGTISMEIQIARGNRKCSCAPHEIAAGSRCVVQYEPDTLASGKSIWKKKNLCLPCAEKLIGSYIRRLETYQKFLRG